MIVVTEHGRYRIEGGEGPGPVYMTVLERDGYPAWDDDEWRQRMELPALRLRVGLHMVWHHDPPIRQIATDEEIAALGFHSNRILAILPEDEAA